MKPSSKRTAVAAFVAVLIVWFLFTTSLWIFDPDMHSDYSELPGFYVLAALFGLPIALFIGFPLTYAALELHLYLRHSSWLSFAVLGILATGLLAGFMVIARYLSNSIYAHDKVCQTHQYDSIGLWQDCNDAFVGTIAFVLSGAIAGLSIRPIVMGDTIDGSSNSRA